MVYPSSFEEKIGFNKIREMLIECCLCTLGIEKVNSISFLTSFKEIRQLINQVAEFKNLLEFKHNFEIGFLADLTKPLKNIRIQGTVLDQTELFDLKRTLDTAGFIIHFLTKEDFPALYQLCSSIKPYPEIIHSIHKILDEHGDIRNNASSKLAEIRGLLNKKQSSISKIIHQILKKGQLDGILDNDSTVVIREGRVMLPVSHTNKRKIKGYIHDTSSTGKTVFIEPAEIVEINNDIKELEYEEGQEIIKILLAVTDQIRPFIDEILPVFDFLAWIDFINAKALLAQTIHAAKPVLHEVPAIDLRDAIHPILYLTHKKENKEVVPLSLKLDVKKRILVISGPNAGGKSVCLKTVGLLQYMLQCGLLIPVKENSELGIFQQIFIDIGDEQSIENDLSTYSSHLINMKFFSRNANDKTLFLIDEFGAGTEPIIGGAIAESVLDKLNKNGAFGIITTHYTNLKHFASSAHGIENGAMLFDIQKIQPLYILQTGEPGSSFAFEIARKIGVPEDILKDAGSRIGQEHIDYDRNLKDIIRDKKYWNEKRQKIHSQEKELDEILVKYKSELEEIKKLRKEILNNAKEKASEIFQNANQKIENTIGEIRRVEAEKTKTRELRKALEDVHNNLIKNEPDESLLLQHKEFQINIAQKRFNKHQPKIITDTVSSEILSAKKSFEIGDKVMIKGQQVAGEIISIEGKKCKLIIGNIKTTINLDKLILLSEKEYDQLNKNFNITKNQSYSGSGISERKLKFKSQIDIRGKRADEALQYVASYLDDAILVNARQIKILHGKGNGILKTLVRDYLRTIHQIQSISDEHVEMGGSGITVVTFEE